MAHDTLFERLARPHGAPQSDANRLRASIMRNLQRILNTRQGSAAALPELGVPAPRELVEEWPACRNRLHKAITASIQRYEPRLRQVQLVALADDQGIGFDFSGELMLTPRTTIHGQIRLDARGHLDLSH